MTCDSRRFDSIGRCDMMISVLLVYEPVKTQLHTQDRLALSQMSLH